MPHLRVTHHATPQRLTRRSSICAQLAPQQIRKSRNACSSRPAAATGAGRVVAAAVTLRLPTQLGRTLRAFAPTIPGSSIPRRQRSGRASAVQVRGMVNVDISPSVVLGVGLIGAGVSLWQIRRVKPWISKDYDVVVSCISLLVGGILIFQGWRLDPLLLFGQLMTTGAAVSFAIEALRLRSEQYESEEKAALQDVLNRKGPGGVGGAGASFQLPPPDQQTQQPWSDAASSSSEQGWAASRQWQPPSEQQPEAGFFGYQQQQQQGPASTSATWGDAPQQQQQYGSSADGQWYFGTGQYQVADYEVPPPAGSSGPDGAAGSGFYSSSGNDMGAGGTSSSSSPPSEFVFPATYVDDGAGAAGEGSSWGAYSEQKGDSTQKQQQGEGQQWGQWGQQSPPAGPAAGRSGGYDMDDW